MNSKSRKFADKLADDLCDSRINEVLVVQELDDAHTDAHIKLMSLILSYISYNAHKYERGIIPAELYDQVRLCKKIKDYALADEIDIIVNPEYVPKGREFLGS